MMSLTWESNARYEQRFLKSFGQRNGIETQYLPSLETISTRLDLYRRLLASHSSQPDLLALDAVWPAILAADLVDLRPYRQEVSNSFAPALLDSYTVRGRLVALPTEVDVGVLYYRPELLEEYGYRNPPRTWEELARMAKRIQAGERRGGNQDFWGYTWQGGAGEALTCNALEWQSSVGAGNFIEPSGAVNVRSARLMAALRMAAGWIGTISPPGEFVYQEADSTNLWDAGQVAFMRNWTSLYGSVNARPGADRKHFAVAPLPGGLGGQRGALGGVALGVSKYAANRDLAIKALLELTDASHDLERVLAANVLPAHLIVGKPTLASQTLLLDLSPLLVSGLVARPSLATGEKYDAVSKAYSNAVNSVLRRQAEPEAAMAELEKKLMQITGLPARRN